MTDLSPEARALWERLQFALDGEPDPWFEFDKAGVDTRQFDKLAPADSLDPLRMGAAA